LIDRAFSVRAVHRRCFAEDRCEALLKILPRPKAEAMTTAQLFEKPIVPSPTPGNKALRQLLAAG